MNIEKIKYFLNLIGHGVNIVDPDLMEEDMVEAGKWSEDDGHNPDDEALNLGVTLERLLVLESAVAFRGFDEMPEITSPHHPDVNKKIDLRRSSGEIIYDISITLHSASYWRESGFTGWRYPVGGLTGGSDEN